MATIAIGDIHGNLAALDDLLGKVLPTLRREDTLVFLGDYVDRGPDSAGCLDRIAGLKKDGPSSVVALIGNHEDWLLNTRRDPTRHTWIFAAQGLSTVKSYSEEAAYHLDREIHALGPRLFLEKLPLSYEVFFQQVPLEHWSLLDSLKVFYESEDVICVHGGVEPDGRALESQPAENLIWGPDGFPDDYRGEKPVVYGHWDDARIDENGWPWPDARENLTFGIDTISHGVLTAMRFPDRKIFQSGRHLYGDRED